MDFVIHGRPFKPESTNYIQEIFDELASKSIPYQISHSFSEILKEANITFNPGQTYQKPAEIKDADIAISLGGDGSFLETLSYVADREIPVLGINFGRLGFLADIQPENIKEIINKLLAREYKIDQRLMVRADSDTPIFESGMNFALNEIAISKTDTSSMIIIHAYIDGEFLNSYWADGLMVATPTGSTGYNLSCGGPLVMPDSENFIITPICPHNLYVRPIIVSSQSEIRLKVESRSNNFLISMDSRAQIVGDEIGELVISLEKFKAKLVKIDGFDFLNTLREKLSWGKDVRNRI
ncbi:NAD kinase [Lacihabitans lacunae]|jgi:NAD+ kinase|uniref:NAD kinase n=1 Tax=Lacihabitans lacunae TaxID=1028214 RepID=A0ABV7YXX0_9BACT